VADDPTWVTLREASDKTSASVSALRKWYRNGAVRSRDDVGRHGPQKLVALEDVAARVEAWQQGIITTRPNPVGRVPTIRVPQALWETTLDELVAAVAAQARAEALVVELRTKLGRLSAATGLDV
jgi:hypothetical protein